jgi:hypothetical protein
LEEAGLTSIQLVACRFVSWAAMKEIVTDDLNAGHEIPKYAARATAIFFDKTTIAK